MVDEPFDDRESGYGPYQREVCCTFRKTAERFGGLSNMATGYPLTIGLHTWRTSEVVYQALRWPDMPDVQQMLLEQHSPMAAKMKSKKYLHCQRPDWLDIRITVMRWVIRVKYLQHPRGIGSLLSEAGTLPIVEESHKDRFWGAVDDGTGLLIGENRLGRLLMELKAEIDEGKWGTGSVLPPPAIDKHILLYEPIASITAEEDPSNERRQLF